MNLKPILLIGFFLITLTTAGCSAPVAATSHSEEPYTALQSETQPTTGSSASPDSTIPSASDTLIQKTYYNSNTGTDGDFIYLGGYGQMQKVDVSTGEMTSLFSESHMIGAAPYQEYLYFIQYQPAAQGGYETTLMRIKKDGTDMQSMFPVDPGCYEVNVYGQTLSLTTQFIYEDQLTTSFFYYNLKEDASIDDSPSLAQDIYKTKNKDITENVDFLLDPLYSMEAYDSIFMYIQHEELFEILVEPKDGTSTTYEILSSAVPFIADQYLFAYYSAEGKLYACSLENGAETTLVTVTDESTIQLLNYDDHWLYYSSTDSSNTVSICRVNVENAALEELFTITSGSLGSLNIYGDTLYYSIMINEVGHWESRPL